MAAKVDAELAKKLVPNWDQSQVLKGDRTRLGRAIRYLRKRKQGDPAENIPALLRDLKIEEGIGDVGRTFVDTCEKAAVNVLSQKHDMTQFILSDEKAGDLFAHLVHGGMAGMMIDGFWLGIIYERMRQEEENTTHSEEARGADR